MVFITAEGAVSAFLAHPHNAVTANIMEQRSFILMEVRNGKEKGFPEDEGMAI
jgi:hypothetical protein